MPYKSKTVQSLVRKFFFWFSLAALFVFLGVVFEHKTETSTAANIFALLAFCASTVGIVFSQKIEKSMTDQSEPKNDADRDKEDEGEKSS